MPRRAHGLRRPCPPRPARRAAEPATGPTTIAAPVAPRPSRAGPSTGARRRPRHRHIVAVLGSYHVGQTIWPGARDRPAPGGFAGVDLFFVLSGFLITTLLLEEAQRRERIDLFGFLRRRAVRLVPALAVALGVLFVAALFGYGQNTPREIMSRGLWALAFQQNGDIPNRLIAELGHTWSLAIEGQFYVLWSVTVTVVVALTRGGRRAHGVLLAVAIGLVVAIAVQLCRSATATASGSTPTRSTWPPTPASTAP